MRTKAQAYSFQSNSRFPILRSDANAKAGDRATTTSKQRTLNCDGPTQQLVWVLISILLLLYLATGYCFGAKTTGAIWR